MSNDVEFISLSVVSGSAPPDERRSMNDVIIYSTGCPRCFVLEQKLADKNVQYQRVEDIDEMLSLGIMEVPVLSVDGERMSFTEAVRWVNNLQGD